MRQFDQFSASELWCPTCRSAQPVRERLLLVLPGGELHEYRCTLCARSLATREVRNPAEWALRTPATAPRREGSRRIADAAPKPGRQPGPRR